MAVVTDKEEVKKVKILTNKQIKVVPIVRGRAFFKKGSDGEFMFSGCKKMYSLPYKESTRSLVNIFEEGEQEAFEKLLNKKEGTLNIYDRKNPFWTKFVVEIKKGGKTLDLNVPMHVLEYKVLKANKELIAPSWAEKDSKASYQFALVDESIIEEADNKLAIKTDKAFDHLYDIKKSALKMRNVLRILGKKVPDDANKEWMKAELIKIIEQKEKTVGVLNIDDFIQAVTDKSAATKILILDAIDAKGIIASNGGYRIQSSNQLIGRSNSEAVDWLEDPKNQEDKLLLEEMIKRNNR